jgi:3-methyladenine DNA glycosylase/8-oxoguanine DNA glycosylase
VALQTVEQDARPPGPYRMPGAGRDGVLRRRDGCLTRLLHHGEEQVTVRAWPVAGAVRLRAEAATREAAAYGVERMRFSLGVDHDLAPFFRHVKRDRLLGPIVRRQPWIRPLRRAEPFEALAWAITEQLIETERAFEIQRRLTWRYGRESACGTLRDAPTPAALAARAPAELAACDLAPKRAIAMVKVAREVAAGRADLRCHEPAWRRLRAISEIGSWTIEKLAFEGQGRDDQLPAGDLAYVKLVGRLAALGRRATEDEVRGFFEPYAPFQGLAGIYLLAGRRFALTGRPPIFAARA